MANAIPEGYHSITPHLVVNNGVDAIEFYKRAFGAVEEYIDIMDLTTKGLSM